MNTEDKLLVVIYVNVDGLSTQKAMDTVNQLQLCIGDNSLQHYIVPIKGSKTKVECLNPELKGTDDINTKKINKEIPEVISLDNILDIQKRHLEQFGQKLNVSGDINIEKESKIKEEYHNPEEVTLNTILNMKKRHMREFNICLMQSLENLKYQNEENTKGWLKDNIENIKEPEIKVEIKE